MRARPSCPPRHPLSRRHPTPSSLSAAAYHRRRATRCCSPRTQCFGYGHAHNHKRDQLSRLSRRWQHGARCRVRGVAASAAGGAGAHPICAISSRRLSLHSSTRVSSCASHHLRSLASLQRRTTESGAWMTMKLNMRPPDSGSSGLSTRISVTSDRENWRAAGKETREAETPSERSQAHVAG